MRYIVFDLEWNQCADGAAAEKAALPFEIIEIGAIKLDAEFKKIGEFSRLVQPTVYRRMNKITEKLVNIEMRDLLREQKFPKVGAYFLKWCELPEVVFCTWGTTDLTELQRNLKYFGLPALSEGPIAFLDVQKLFSLCFEDGKARRALEVAVDMVEIEKPIPFHRAFADAFYTAKILQLIAAKKPELLQKISFDVFTPPADRDKEIRIQFDSYYKYITREFASKVEAFEDKEVASSKCYLCHKNLRKKIKWFSANGKHYYCLAYCEKHGYLKGKIRVRKTEDGGIYIVKTTKLISEEDAEGIRERKAHAVEMRKKHK